MAYQAMTTSRRTSTANQSRNSTVSSRDPIISSCNSTTSSRNSTTSSRNSTTSLRNSTTSLRNHRTSQSNSGLAASSSSSVAAASASSSTSLVTLPDCLDNGEEEEEEEENMERVSDRDESDEILTRSRRGDRSRCDTTELNRLRSPSLIGGYNLTTNVSSSNMLIINYNVPVVIERITFRPTVNNVDDTFSLSLQSKSIVGSLSMTVVPNSTGQIMTFNTQYDFGIGWQIVISRGEISTILGAVSSVEITGTGNNRQVRLVVIRDQSIVIPALFQIEGINQINYSIPLMSNMLMVDAEPILYTSEFKGTIVRSDQQLMLSYSNVSSTVSKRIVLYLQYHTRLTFDH